MCHLVSKPNSERNRSNVGSTALQGILLALKHKVSVKSSTGPKITDCFTNAWHQSTKEQWSLTQQLNRTWMELFFRTTSLSRIQLTARWTICKEHWLTLTSARRTASIAVHTNISSGAMLSEIYQSNCHTKQYTEHESTLSIWLHRQHELYDDNNFNILCNILWSQIKNGKERTKQQLWENLKCLLSQSKDWQARPKEAQIQTTRHVSQEFSKKRLKTER